ncbi:MAG: flagellar biosynthesis anti-sigma factor FlgM [Phycisphaerales bacterium]|nr:flagellar biosynthesis anti-sigma factor FlgM [Phycisphaerales bacterium]
MTDISSIGHHFAPGPANAPSGVTARSANGSVTGLGPVDRAGSGTGSGSGSTLNRLERQDRLELSGQARLLDRMRQMPAIRQELVDRVKGQIADGTYESPQKLAVALDRLIDDVLAEA